MIKSILMTPWNVVRNYIQTATNLPAEFRDWRRKVAMQEPVRFDEERFVRTGTSLDPDKLYSLPIAYSLILFWMFGSGSGTQAPKPNDATEGNGKTKPESAKKLEGLAGFFAQYKIERVVGTIWEFRLSDGYFYLTQKWLSFFGDKPRSFKLYQVVGGVKNQDIPNSLEGNKIGVLMLKAQLGIDDYQVVYIAVNGEGSYWRDQFNEYHGVAAIAAMLEDAVVQAKKIHEEEFAAWRARVGVSGGR